MTHKPGNPDEFTRAQDLAMMSEEILADLGTGTVAYIRELGSADVAELFPDAPQVAENARFWALVNADGTPIVVADSREAVLANAFEHELETVSVH